MSLPFNNNCIIVHYPSYAGGKFIQNCLALSRHSLIKSSNTIDNIIKNPTNYDYRINIVLSTLPSNHNLKEWVSKYELGDGEFYGNGFDLWQRGLTPPHSKVIKTILNSGLKFCVTAHSLGIVENLLCTWKNATILTLVNYNKFQTLAQGLKSDEVVKANPSKKEPNPDPPPTNCTYDFENKEKYNSLKSNDWPAWGDFQFAGYNINKFDNIPHHIKKEISTFYPSFKNKQLVFDVDRCFLDKEYFIVAMAELYDDLGLDDFNKELVLLYWQKYTDLHIQE